MNVEDSYEGALRRLSRLQRAGVHLAPPPEPEPEPDDRMRDLEELATLACDENEKLKQELSGARREIDHLRQLVATLQGSLMSAEPDEPLNVPRSRGGPFLFFLFILFAGGGVAVYAMRPWEHHAVPVAASAAALPSEPVAVTPAPTPAVAPPVAKTEPTIPKAEPTIPKVATTIPKAEPTIPKAEPTIPKVATTVPKVAPPADAPKASRRHVAKAHVAKSARHKPPKHASRKASSKMEPRSDDPLGGLNM
jgi:hypothetical protein